MSTRAPTHAESASPFGTPCSGWEIVCPDGRVRHYPYHNREDAEDTALEAEARRASTARCSFWDQPSDLELSQPQCPGGSHVVRLIPMQHITACRGSA